MILLLVFTVFLSSVRAQNPWSYTFQPQLPPNPQHNNLLIPANGFVPLNSNGIQPFDGFAYGNRPFFNGGPVQNSPPPRMQLLRIQLVCETVPAQKQPLIRWIRRDSSTIASTPITIAEGANAIDPLQFAVNVENLPNGAMRSILTILRPEPDSSQAAYYCQTVLSTSSMIESREVYVIGNKQFVNANMAYQAADIFPTYRRLHPGEGLVKEAVESKITSSTETPQSSTLPIADIKLVTPIPYLYNISQWLIYH